MTVKPNKLIRWNLVSLLVLLCQGMLFENLLGGQEDAVVLVFGILIILIVVMCIFMTAYSVLIQALSPNTRKLIPLPRRSAQGLPRDWVLELFVLNSLAKMDFEREIEIDLAEFKAVLTLREFEELASAMEIVFETNPQVRLSDRDSRMYGDGSYTSETILPRKPAGQISPKIFDAHNRMLSDFQLKFNKDM
jgi:ABC-type transport system involved in multi-copper enzyme maturation permease subunit